ncbi:MAG: Zn-dependent exopeptidase M28 [Firmicutes bacterium]|nr:Zn-dependent exopeptidase M28 [Bacillota bacterium]
MDILEAIVVPRPNGSTEFYRTAEYIQEWLAGQGLSVETHLFSMRPFFFEIVAAAIIAAALLFIYLAFFRKSWLAVLPVLLLGLVMLFEASLGTTIISGMIRKDAENIIVSIQPETAERELILSAHYDSKTQPLDHRQRELVFQLIIPSVAAGVLLPLLWWGLHYRRRRPGKKVSLLLGAVLALLPAYWLLLAFTFGGGFMARPSPGAVDNGTAVSVLMNLSKELQETALEKTAVTVVLFAAEELNMQGSQAYLRDHPREGALPAYNVNLELVCQEGDYVYWQEDGVFTTRYPTAGMLNEMLDKATLEVTGQNIKPLEADFTTISDSGSFLAAGIPSTTLGNAGSAELGCSFFHSHLDNMERVVPERIEELVQILKQFTLNFDAAEI